jgi:hypothetical protein
VYRARERVYLPNELRSFAAASAEQYRREKGGRDNEQRNWDHRPASEPAWMVALDQKFKDQPSLKNSWGYITF